MTDGPRIARDVAGRVGGSSAKASSRDVRDAVVLFPGDHPQVRNDIAELGAVSDGQTIGLVNVRGDLTYLCWPLLDSPSLFGGLLREDAREALYIDADEPVEPVSQLYRGHSDILDTHVTVGGVDLTITDMMARVPLTRAFLRRYRAGDRPVRFSTMVRPGFDYGRATHEVCKEGRTATANFIALSPDCATDSAEGESIDVAVLSPDPVAAVKGTRGLGEAVVVTHELAPHEETWVALAMPYDVDAITPDLFRRAEEGIRQDERELIETSIYRGPDEDIVLRSAATLRMLECRHERASQKPPGIAAAGTFSLPEAHKGERNYDYRFVWTRDASLCAEAMTKLGFGEQARSWVEFAVDRNGSASRQPLALMRTLSACDVPNDEKQPDGFTGLYHAQPVRIGNAAAGQLQLDVFGALLLAAHALQRHEIALKASTRERLAEAVDWLVDHWNAKDSSIWEMRSGEEHYLFSRLMCWIAFDRALDMNLEITDERRARWDEAREAVRDDIETRFWCPDTRSYMQTPHFAFVDSAAVYMRLSGFLDDGNERWLGTKRAVREKLMTVTGLLRYPDDVDDGFETKDNPFILCTCWWIEALVMDGEVAEARLLFDMLRDRLGPTMLASEEIDEQGRLMGNIPQGFSHLGLINAALALAKAEGSVL